MTSVSGRWKPYAGVCTIRARVRASEGYQRARAHGKAELALWRCVSGRGNQRRLQLRRNLTVGAVSRREPGSRGAAKPEGKDRYDDQPKHQPHPLKMDPGVPLAKAARCRG